MASEGVQMLTGVVAMIDALGFKGAWGDVKKPSMEVLRSLRHIGRAAKLHANEANFLLRKDLPAERKHFLKTPDVSVVQLSDTLVVAAGRRQRLRAIWKRHAAAHRGRLLAARSSPISFDRLQSVADLGRVWQPLSARRGHESRQRLPPGGQVWPSWRRTL